MEEVEEEGADQLGTLALSHRHGVFRVPSVVPPPALVTQFTSSPAHRCFPPDSRLSGPPCIPLADVEVVIDCRFNPPLDHKEWKAMCAQRPSFQYLQLGSEYNHRCSRLRAAPGSSREAQILAEPMTNIEATRI